MTNEEILQTFSDINYAYNDCTKYDTLKRMLDELTEPLPSAQPEIVRCCQCKYAEVADKEDAQDGYTCQFHRGSVWFSGSYCSWAESEEV